MQRRRFLKSAAVIGSGILAQPLIRSCSPKATASGTEDDFGLQLYTLRDILSRDPKSILEQVASFGYRQLESYEGPHGMFWGMKPAEFKNFNEGLGMRVIASHCDINAGFEQKAEQAAECGMTYLVCPWLGPQENMDVFKAAAEKFNRC